MTEAAAGPLSAELQAERRKVRPPVQLTVPKGGVAFRELRVWVSVTPLFRAVACCAVPG